MNTHIFILSGAIALLGFLIRLTNLVKQKGLDPSLVTLANPLIARGMLGFRLLLVVGLILSAMGAVYAKFFLIIVLMAACFQLFVLAVFGRSKTQAVSYYFLAAVVSAGLLWQHSWAWSGLGLIVIFIQELLFYRWKLTQTRRYNRWVADIAANINKKYRSIAKTTTPREWLWVLHIATTEQIARPNLVRWAERAYFYVKRPAFISTGIMQIRAARPLTDYDSVAAGTGLIRAALADMPKTLKNHESQIQWLATSYNGSSSYAAYLKATWPGVELAWQKIHRR